MRNIISLLKKILFLKQADCLNTLYLLKRWNIRFGPYFYKRKYKASDIVHQLQLMGVGKGSNLFIHSAWDSFYNYEGTESELIDAILELIGDEGTLAMPAFPIRRKGKLFNVRKSVTAAGMLCEAFRKYSNVQRSANVRHSVCACGPLAHYLTCDHHHSLIAFDEHSPYYRLCEKHFQVILLGLPHYYVGTFIYVSKAALRHEIPYFAQFYDENRLNTVNYIDADGNERSYQEIYEPQISIRKSYLWTKYLMRKYVDKDKYICRSLSNLNLTCIDAYTVNQTLCELALKNIFIYNYPFVKKGQRMHMK